MEEPSEQGRCGDTLEETCWGLWDTEASCSGHLVPRPRYAGCLRSAGCRLARGTQVSLPGAGPSSSLGRAGWWLQEKRFLLHLTPRAPPRAGGCRGLVCVLVAPGHQTLVGFGDSWANAAPDPAVPLAAPVVIGAAQSLVLHPPHRLCLPPAGSLPQHRLSIPSCPEARAPLELCLTPCLPSHGTWGFKEAVFPFLLPLCSLSVGPRTSWAPHHATPPRPAVLPDAFLPSPGGAGPCTGRQRAQKRWEKPHVPL